LDRCTHGDLAIPFEHELMGNFCRAVLLCETKEPRLSHPG
jgi:hypothetical protein